MKKEDNKLHDFIFAVVFLKGKSSEERRKGPELYTALWQGQHVLMLIYKLNHHKPEQPPARNKRCELRERRHHHILANKSWSWREQKVESGEWMASASDVPLRWFCYKRMVWGKKQKSDNVVWRHILHLQYVRTRYSKGKERGRDQNCRRLSSSWHPVHSYEMGGHGFTLD